MIEGLLAEGFQFYRWPMDDSLAVRLVTAFDSRAEDVEALIAAARRLAAGDRKTA